MGRYLGFSLEVDDVWTFYVRFKDEVRFTGPPEVQTWGGVMTAVSDVDGNTLTIVEMPSGG